MSPARGSLPSRMGTGARRGSRATRTTGALGAMVLAGALLMTTGVAHAAEPIGGADLAGTEVVVHPSEGAPALPDVKAETWLVADATTGEVLAAKGAHVRRAPASTLKTLLALTVMPQVSPDRTITVGPKVTNVGGTRVGLARGHTYTLDQLWYAVFLPSANDAAVAVAKINGGLAHTVDQMNQTAAQLQAHDTVAKTPNGLDAPGQVSSAYDLALIARAGMSRSDFAKYAGTARTSFPDSTGTGEHTITTTNRLLLHGWPGMLGVKTGFTTHAGRTYVGMARRGDRTVLVTLMGIHEPSADAARKLLSWGFAADGKVTPVGTLVQPGAPVPGGAEQVSR